MASSTPPAAPAENPGRAARAGRGGLPGVFPIGVGVTAVSREGVVRCGR
jgi:hypothetical protein